MTLDNAIQILVVIDLLLVLCFFMWYTNFREAEV